MISYRFIEFFRKTAQRNVFFYTNLRAIKMFVIFLLFSFPLFATNWQVAIKNRQYLYNNTCLYLTETTGALQGKKVSINMRMRGQASPFFTFQKNMEWLMGLQPVSISYFRFSKGNYTFFVDIYCAETGETTSLELEYNCLPIENGLYASDIFLDYSPIRFLGEKSPILSEKIDERNPNLHFYQEINANKTVLTARAILYQEKKSQGNTNATTYTSLRQVNQVLSLQNRTAYFVGNFDLTSLLSGKYLIEILIYADAQLLSEKNTRFEISQEQVFLRPEQIDKSIADLVLLCSSQQIAQLKTLPNALEKKQALLHIFEQHYPKEGIAQATHYFAKIQSVHQRFANETAFWQSPRVNTFLRYGEPDQIEKMALKGKEFQKWKYSKWNLMLVFEKKEEKWVLVK